MLLTFFGHRVVGLVEMMFCATTELQQTILLSVDNCQKVSAVLHVNISVCYTFILAYLLGLLRSVGW